MYFLIKLLVSKLLVLLIECTLKMFTRVARDVIKIVALRLDVHKLMRSWGTVFIDKLSHDVLFSWVLIDSKVQDLMFQAHVQQVVEVNIVDVSLSPRMIIVLTSRSMLSRLCRSRMCWWRRWARWRRRNERLMLRLYRRRRGSRDYWLMLTFKTWRWTWKHCLWLLRHIVLRRMTLCLSIKVLLQRDVLILPSMWSVSSSCGQATDDVKITSKQCSTGTGVMVLQRKIWPWTPGCEWAAAGNARRCRPVVMSRPSQMPCSFWSAMRCWSLRFSRTPTSPKTLAPKW